MRLDFLLEALLEIFLVDVLLLQGLLVDVELLNALLYVPLPRAKLLKSTFQHFLGYRDVPTSLKPPVHDIWPSQPLCPCLEGSASHISFNNSP
jgi:hypothetical protein